MLTLKASDALVTELESFAKERGLTRHAAALEAVAAGISALRGRGDTGGDTPAGHLVTPEVIPNAEALADLVAEKVVARLAAGGGDTRDDTGPRTGWIEVHLNGLDHGVSGIKSALALLTEENPPNVAEAIRFLRDGALFELEPYLAGAREPKRKGAGKVPRRPGDSRIGGQRKADPPEGSVAAEVLTWRRSRGFSQEQAAEAFGVARKTWGRWESGERYPEAAVVARIKGQASTT